MNISFVQHDFAIGSQGNDKVKTGELGVRSVDQKQAASAIKEMDKVKGAGKVSTGASSQTIVKPLWDVIGEVSTEASSKPMVTPLWDINL